MDGEGNEESHPEPRGNRYHEIWAGDYILRPHTITDQKGAMGRRTTKQALKQDKNTIPCLQYVMIGQKMITSTSDKASS